MQDATQINLEPTLNTIFDSMLRPGDSGNEKDFAKKGLKLAEMS